MTEEFDVMSKNNTVIVNHETIKLAVAALRTDHLKIATLTTSLVKVIGELTEDGLETNVASKALSNKSVEFFTEATKAARTLDALTNILENAYITYQRADGELASQLGGGRAASRLTINLADLEDLRSALLPASQALNDGRNASYPSLDDSLGDQRVATAMREFDTQWDIRRAKLIQSIDGLAAACDAIITTMDSIDSQLHTALTNEGRS